MLQKKCFMRIIVLCFLLFVRLSTNAQDIDRLLSNLYGVSIKQDRDKSVYDVKTIMFNDKIFKVDIYHGKNGIVSEEYIRYDDSSFFCTKYDERSNSISRGLIIIDISKRSYDTVLLQDLVRDPTLIKGILIEELNPYYHFEKNGFWVEREKNGEIGMGEYKMGKRNGIWRFGNLDYTYTGRDSLLIIKYLSCYYGNETIKNYKQDFSKHKFF